MLSLFSKPFNAMTLPFRLPLNFLFQISPLCLCLTFSTLAAPSSGLVFVHTHRATFSSSSSLPALSPPSLFSAAHQSLALASPLRAYGMMDRRASGASEAKGHLPGAPRRGGSPGASEATSTPHVCFETLPNTTCSPIMG